MREAFRAQAFGEVEGADFADAVVDQPGGGDKRRHGRDGDDVAFALGEHAREEGADEHEVGEEVYLEEFLGFRVGRLRGLVSFCYTGAKMKGERTSNIVFPMPIPALLISTLTVPCSLLICSHSPSSAAVSVISHW